MHCSPIEREINDCHPRTPTRPQERSKSLVDGLGTGCASITAGLAQRQNRQSHAYSLNAWDALVRFLTMAVCA